MHSRGAIGTGDLTALAEIGLTLAGQRPWAIGSLAPVAISPGEKERGYAATTVFADLGDRRAVAHTLPDELRRLARHGFELPGFLTEARTNGGRA